jgi:hypothetical protein
MITATDIANFLNTQQYNQSTELCKLMEKHKSDKSLLIDNNIIVIIK